MHRLAGEASDVFEKVNSPGVNNNTVARVILAVKLPHLKMRADGFVSVRLV